ASRDARERRRGDARALHARRRRPAAREPHRLPEGRPPPPPPGRDARRARGGAGGVAGRAPRRPRGLRGGGGRVGERGDPARARAPPAPPARRRDGDGDLLREHGGGGAARRVPVPARNRGARSGAGAGRRVGRPLAPPPGPRPPLGARTRGARPVDRLAGGWDSLARPSATCDTAGAAAWRAPRHPPPCRARIFKDIRMPHPARRAGATLAFHGMPPSAPHLRRDLVLWMVALRRITVLAGLSVAILEKLMLPDELALVPVLAMALAVCIYLELTLLGVGELGGMVAHLGSGGFYRPDAYREWGFVALVVMAVTTVDALCGYLSHYLIGLLGEQEERSRALAAARADLLARNEREAARVRVLLDVAQHVSAMHTVEALLRAV